MPSAESAVRLRERWRIAADRTGERERRQRGGGCDGGFDADRYQSEERAFRDALAAAAASGERLAAAVECASIGRGYGHQNAAALSSPVAAVTVRHTNGGRRTRRAVAAEQTLPRAAARQAIPRLVVLQERQLPLVQRATPPPMRIKIVCRLATVRHNQRSIAPRLCGTFRRRSINYRPVRQSIFTMRLKLDAQYSYLRVCERVEALRLRTSDRLKKMINAQRAWISPRF